MDKDQQNIPKGSGRQVEDYSSFCEGDIEPTLNKKIRTFIDGTQDYIVYLDPDFFVQWSFRDSYEPSVPKSIGSVANAIGHLETLSRTQLRKTQLYDFESMLAEGMARIVGDKDEHAANELLDKARTYLEIRGIENARYWYLLGSSITAVLCLISIVLLSIFRTSLVQFLSNDGFQVVLGALCGGLGALFSIITRSNKILMDPAAGAFIHYVESASRIIAGSLGALLVALAIKSDIFLGVVKSVNHSLALVLALCFCAGASERFVRGIIKRVEDSTIPSNGKQ